MVFSTISFASALDLNIEKISGNEVMIAGVNQPVLFELEIKNLGADTNVEFYNLVGFRMLPSGFVSIKSQETKIITLQVSPLGDFDHIGFYTFTYFIRDENDVEIEKELTFKRLEMEDALEIGADEFNPESSSIKVFVRNKENFDFGTMNAKFSSLFFNVEDSFELGPKERRSVSVSLNKEDFNRLLAGFYTMDVDLKADEAEANLATSIRFVEKDIIKTEEDSSGFIVNTKVTKKTNEGNIQTYSQISVKKNIISRLFTTFNSEPDVVERNGLGITYTWTKYLNPGETLETRVRTNWTFPLIIVLIIVGVVALAKRSQKTPLLLKKRVNFVRAKGGEFALKVTLYVRAREFVEKVQIIERLPPLVSLYEKFGPEKPTKVDEKNKRVEWFFDHLEAGEVRLMSYVIYSKVGVFGKFALPSMRGIYEQNGQAREAESNKAFFVTEQRGAGEVE